ncbi:MAG: MOSC domain-containing protein, partial [Chloroflexi bacterium]|nr:MOSC domain-containing protein [Chloroflexota bacterium]
LGVEGDFHSGPINQHKKSGPPEPNRRQVSIVAWEVMRAVGEELGISLKPGDLAENVLVEGLGDLASLREDDRIHLGADVVLEVTGQNKPCVTLNVHHPDIVRPFVGRRGVVAVVVATGEVRPGDPVRVAAGASTPIA